ncbi:MAG: RsmE family RNA methyltransferase [Cyanobacteriota bacterium]
MKHIPHFFISEKESEEKIISDDIFHHLIQVLRLKESSLFTCADNKGNFFECKIVNINKKNLTYEILQQSFFEKNNIEISLFQGITKIDVFEEILDKATQLGIDNIYPVIMDYSIISKDIYLKKQERFEKIIRSASEQSKRNFIPKLHKIEHLKNRLEILNPFNSIICYEKAKNPLKNILKTITNKEKINVLIGSEGGVSENEAKFFSENNYKIASISNNILRSETAVILALSNIIYELD